LLELTIVGVVLLAVVALEFYGVSVEITFGLESSPLLTVLGCASDLSAEDCS
jgi:hypothetical protein